MKIVGQKKAVQAAGNAHGGRGRQRTPQNGVDMVKGTKKEKTMFGELTKAVQVAERRYAREATKENGLAYD